MASSSTKPPPQAFEFTKRKRWSETLFSELSEAIVFVLSPSCKVLFCGTAVVELLGWKEDQLVDTDLAQFIEDEDQESFRWSFTESLRSGQDMFSYVRFKLDQHPPVDINSKPGMLFEVKGHPHHVQGRPEPQCFFLTAMPYPSRNAAMLNTFLDLKIENEKLSQRVKELKISADMFQALDLPLSPQYSMPHHPPRYHPAPLIHNHPLLYSRSGPSQPYFPLSGASGRASTSGLDGTIVSPVHGLNPLGVAGDEDGDVEQRKKKMKKSLVGDEQRVCVTCGRTDSPEWRKGPHGPKTLCNACGLRWAKRTRKVEPDSSSNPNSRDAGASGPGSSVGPPSAQQSSF